VFPQTAWDVTQPLRPEVLAMTPWDDPKILDDHQRPDNEIDWRLEVLGSDATRK
jgi:hypothetical protein